MFANTIRARRARALALTTALAGSLGLASPVAAQLVTSADVSVKSNSITSINTAGNTTTVTANANGIINWNRFDVPNTTAVNFTNSSGSNIAILNRVVGGTFSNIDGAINSDPNVAVYIINPNGILFGSNARVNVGSLVASTIGLTNDVDFLSGAPTLSFSGAAGSSTGISIASGAEIKTGRNGVGGLGNLVLIGAQLDSAGTLDAAGDVVMAAGTDLSMNLNGGPISVTLNQGTSVAAAVKTSGTINGRNVTLAFATQSGVTNGLLDVSGMITATTAAAGDKGIVLAAGSSAANVTVAAAAGTSGAASVNQSAGSLVTAGAATTGLTAKAKNAATFSGTILSDGGVSLAAGSDLIANSITSNDGDIVLAATGDATVTGNVSGGGSYTVTGYNIRLGQDAGTESQTVAGNVDLKATNVLFGGEGLTLQSSGGSVFLEGTQGIAFDGTSRINAADLVGVVAAAPGAGLFLGTVDASRLTAVSAAHAPLAALNWGGAVNVGQLILDQSLSLRASGDPLTVGSVIISDPLGSIQLSSSSDRVTVGDLTAHSIAVGSGYYTRFNGQVNASSLEIQGGSFEQGAFGRISVDVLSGTATNVTLNGNNRIAEIKDFTGSTVAIRNAQGDLRLGGTISAGLTDIAIRNDGGDIVVASGAAIMGRVISLSASDAFVNQSGANALNASNRWIIYSAAPEGNVYGGLDSGQNAIWNATFDSLAPASVASGNRYVFAHQPTLTFTSTNITKTYGDDVNGALSMAYTVSGLHPGVAGAFNADTLANVINNGRFTVTSEGAAARADVAGGPYVITIGQGTLQATTGYALAFDSAGRITVNRKTVTPTVTANDKVYDGLTGATGSIVDAAGDLLAGDDVAISGGTFTFADKNAGTGKTVSVTGAALTGADADNYQLVLPASVLADILKKAVTVTIVVDDKTYNGQIDATGRVAGVEGLIQGDDLSLTGGSYSFADKNAGTNKTVTVSGITVGGADAGNYEVSIPATVLADILKKAVTVTIAVDDKTYDGTTSAEGRIADADGFIPGEAVFVTGGTFTFADKNAGTDKTVLVSGVTVGGADAGNYEVTIPATVLADILKKAISVTIAADSKTYDGMRAATGRVTGVSGAVTGDKVTVSGGTYTFADKNAGTGKAVSVTGLTLSGDDAGNYVLTIPQAAVADILKKTVQVSPWVNGKEYDGTTTATANVVVNGIVAGDTATATGGIFTFEDANAGSDKVVHVSGIRLTGADAGNYEIVVPETVFADINRRNITVKALDTRKTIQTDDPAFLYFITQGSLVAGDAFTGALTRDPGEDPGIYFIRQGSLGLSDNYEISFVPGRLTIDAGTNAVAPDPVQSVNLGAQVVQSATTASEAPLVWDIDAESCALDDATCGQ